MLKIGKAAPNFTATGHDGEEVELSSLNRRWLVLWWFPAANEPGSTTQAIAFGSAHADFDTEDCDIVGISFDSEANTKSFHDNNALPFNVLSDPEQTVGPLYQATRNPEEHSKFARRISYLIDPEGYIVQSYEVTDPGGHAAEVLSDLKAAQR